MRRAKGRLVYCLLMLASVRLSQACSPSLEGSEAGNQFAVGYLLEGLVVCQAAVKERHGLVDGRVEARKYGRRGARPLVNGTVKRGHELADTVPVEAERLFLVVGSHGRVHGAAAA